MTRAVFCLLKHTAQLQYQFASTAERGFSPWAIIRSAGGCQRRGQLPAGGATVRAAVVSGRAQETRTLQKGEQAKHIALVSAHALAKMFFFLTSPVFLLGQVDPNFMIQDWL